MYLQALPQPFRNIDDNLQRYQPTLLAQDKEKIILDIFKDCIRVIVAVASGVFIYRHPAWVISKIWDKGTMNAITNLGIFSLAHSTTMLIGAGGFTYLCFTSIISAFAKKSLADLGGAIVTGMIAHLLSENYKHYEKCFGEDIIIRLFDKAAKYLEIPKKIASRP